jgi:hypothetical protein
VFFMPSPFFFAVPSRLAMTEHVVNLDELTTVLSANICIDRIGQPRSAPLLLGYTPLVGNFLEGPTVPRSQEIRVEQATLFVAQPATTSIPSEHPDLIPTRKFSEMAPIDPYELMGRKSKGKGKAKQGAQAKKPKRAVFEVIAPEQATQSAYSDSVAQEEPTQPPQVVEIDEAEIVAEPSPRAKRASRQISRGRRLRTTSRPVNSW